jgi:hypothetical protein
VAGRKPPMTAAQACKRVVELEAALAAEPERHATWQLQQLADELGFESTHALVSARDRLAEGLELLDAADGCDDPKVALAADPEALAFAEALGPLNKIADRLRELGIGVGEREPVELAGLIVRMLG